MQAVDNSNCLHYLYIFDLSYWLYIKCLSIYKDKVQEGGFRRRIRDIVILDFYSGGNRRGRLRLESEREIDESFGNSRCASEALDVSIGGRFYENG